MNENDARPIDRLVRKKSLSDKQSQASTVVCAVASSSKAVDFATTMCIDCRRAQGRRLSAEMSKGSVERPLACPHCGLLVGDAARTIVLSPALADLAQAVVYPRVRATTLHRLAERWQRLQSAPVALAQGGEGRSSASGSTGCLGLSVASFFEEVDKQVAAAKRGIFLSEHAVPAIALSTSDTVLTRSAPVSSRDGAGVSRARTS